MNGQIVLHEQAELAALLDLQEAAMDYIQASRAENTVRAYDSDWSHFEDWALSMELETRPARPETVELYAVHMAQEGYKTSTIQRRMVAISKKHKASGYDSPAQAELVRKTLAGIWRKHGTKKQGKSPILTDHIREWADSLDDGVMAKRDLAVVLIGFAGAFRRSEISRLNLEDVELTSQGMVITLRRSKTDQEGEGRRVGIPFGENGNTYPVRALRKWIDAAENQDGPLFRQIRRGGHVQKSRLGDRAITAIIKRMCGAIGLDPDKYSGHSLRAGHVTQSAASEFDTMRQTGHKSLEIFRGNRRDIDLFINNSATTLGLLLAVIWE